MRRVLSTFDMTCIGVNAIVGSGIYLFPGKLGAALGPSSIVAWLVTGVLCLPLALTFAALGATEVRTGGPVRYAERAFGRGAAFVVGWSAWVTSVVSWAAVASGLPSYLAVLVPGTERGAGALFVTVGTVVGFSVLNAFGVKPGARFTVALTLGKLVPLAIFVVAGLWFVDATRFEPFAPRGFAELPIMALMVMFAYQGFEVVGVPAGEVAAPRRAIPFAVITSVLLAALLYVLIQLVFVGVGGRDGGAPLPDAAQGFLGPSGAVLLGAGGLISMLGFNAGTALSTPRYLVALAEEGSVPPLLARSHARFETPVLAIAATALIVLVLTLVSDFAALVEFAVLAVLTQYVASSAALLRLAARRSLKALGLVALAVSVVFGLKSEVRQFVMLAMTLLVGTLVALATRLTSRASGRVS